MLTNIVKTATKVALVGAAALFATTASATTYFLENNNLGIAGQDLAKVEVTFNPSEMNTTVKVTPIDPAVQVLGLGFQVATEPECSDFSTTPAITDAYSCSFEPDAVTDSSKGFAFGDAGKFSAKADVSPPDAGNRAESFSLTIAGMPTFLLNDPSNPDPNAGFMFATHVYTENSGDTGFAYGGSLTSQEVPVPAAGWLFGSGMLGMVAVARRKRNATRTS